MALDPQYTGSGGGLYPASSQSQIPGPVGANKIEGVPAPSAVGVGADLRLRTPGAQFLVSGGGIAATIAAERIATRRPALIQAAAWAGGATIAQYDERRLSTGQLIVATTGGTTHASTEPTFSATAAMVDNTVTWWAKGRMSMAPPAGVAVPVVSEQTTAIGTIYNIVNAPTRFRQPITPDVIAGTGSGDTQNNTASLFWDGSTADNGLGANGLVGMLRVVEVITDSDVLDIGTFSIGGSSEQLKVYVGDDAYSMHMVNEAPIRPTAGGTRYQRVSYATTEGRKNRWWRVECPGWMILKGISVTAGSTFLPAPKVGLTGLWLGDSFHNTTTPALTQASAINADSLASRALKLAGVRDCADAGIGGTGYVANNTTKLNVLQLLQNSTNAANLSVVAPDVVVFAHGYNDGATGSGITTAQAAANAVASWSLARSMFPNAVIHVFGPWSANKSGVASMIAMGAALEAAFQTWADPRSGWESPITGNTIVRGVKTLGVTAWTTGSGYVGATTGSGNSDIYTGSDGAHPSPAGLPAIYARRCGDAIARTMGSFAG